MRMKLNLRSVKRNHFLRIHIRNFTTLSGRTMTHWLWWVKPTCSEGLWSPHTQKKTRVKPDLTKVLTITRRIGEWRIWWNTYKDGWRGTGWKNSLKLFEKTRRRKDIGALQREMTNHHRINLKPLHRPTYTANKVSGEITVKQFWKGGAHWPSLPKGLDALTVQREASHEHLWQEWPSSTHCAQAVSQRDTLSSYNPR